MDFRLQFSIAVSCRIYLWGALYLVPFYTFIYVRLIFNKSVRKSASFKYRNFWRTIHELLKNCILTKKICFNKMENISPKIFGFIC